MHTTGHADSAPLCFHGEDRLPQLGPIAAFALGPPATVGSAKGSGDPILRGAPQLLACVGQGRTGALAVVRGGIVPLQDSAVDFTPLGRCTGACLRKFATLFAICIVCDASWRKVTHAQTRAQRASGNALTIYCWYGVEAYSAVIVTAYTVAGVWGLEHGPEADQELPDHEYMIISFEKGDESSTFVYKFRPDGPPQAVSDLDSCEFTTNAGTVCACSMFDRQGIVQVRSAL